MKVMDRVALKLELMELNRRLDQGMWNLESLVGRGKFEELCRRQSEIKELLKGGDEMEEPTFDPERGKKMAEEFARKRMSPKQRVPKGESPAADAHAWQLDQMGNWVKILKAANDKHDNPSTNS